MRFFVGMMIYVGGFVVACNHIGMPASIGVALMILANNIQNKK